MFLHCYFQFLHYYFALLFLFLHCQVLKTLIFIKIGRWTCIWCYFLQQLTTMVITRCRVCFFGLFLLELFLSPFALGLKHEVGVWVKLTWWALLLRFIHSMHRLWFHVVQLLQMSLCASFCACGKNKLLLYYYLKFFFCKKNSKFSSAGSYALDPPLPPLLPDSWLRASHRLRVVVDLVFDEHYSNNTAKSYFTTYLLLLARTMILSFKTGIML